MDKYLQYDHIELSEDPSFIRWAKSSTPLDDKNWDEWLINHPNKAETAAKAKSIVLAMKFVNDTPSKETEEKIWSSISNEINTVNQEEKKSRTSRRGVLKMIAYGAAAAIALILLFQNIGNDFDTTVNVPYAKTETINLPDGSIVTVNSGSTVEFDKASWEENRFVALEGEAFFDVQKGSTFTVKSASGSVTVLGTSFNVFDRDDSFKVLCETGKVSVKSAGKESILMPDQSVTVVDAQHIVEENIAESDKRSTWRNGVFVYKATALKEVVEELQRQFNIQIEITEDLLATQYTGSFRKTEIETALTEVFFPLKMEYSIEGNTVQISKSDE